jgi:ankyrin repeat protein
VKLLLEKGSLVNQANPNGSTPLHFAAGCGHAEVVKLLLEGGADPQLKDKEKMRPSDLAKSLKEGQWETTLQLLGAS